MWSQELWIQSASSTQKLPFASIRQVTSEPIKGHEEYHIVVRMASNVTKNLVGITLGFYRETEILLVLGSCSIHSSN
jgi:hypothetical protein